MGGLTTFAAIDDGANLVIRCGTVDETLSRYLKADINQGLPADISRMGALVFTHQDQAKQIIDKARDELAERFNGMSD